MANQKKGQSGAARIAKRWFIDALSSMALGLFASLIIGLIIEQLGKIPKLDFLTAYSACAKSVSGAAIGVAIAYGLKAKPLVIFSSAAVGAFSYELGGPFGAYVAALVGAEIGNLLAGRTKFDIVLVPLTTIIPGCIIAALTGPYIQIGLDYIGNFINTTTELNPVPMGILVSVTMGMALTAPISSAAIAISLGLEGIAGGAACVGCCANMIGFAVASFRENKWSGLVSQGVGTSMLQVGNIVRRPWIWLPAILTSAILGPISSAVLKMTTYSGGAGMGTSGFVGPFLTYTSMTDGGRTILYTVLCIVFMHFIFPAVISLGISEGMRKLGWIRQGDMALRSEI
ncbi:MAG: PTS sugar transporter subunit IIC [Oscillospiraceae bacterium]|nr:PTS sugar transporter subunit IIC [Oscillospiraceae bacterium]